MGLFGKKKKGKSRVSFEADVGSGTAAIRDTIEVDAAEYNNDSTSSSEKRASMKEILMPFREPRAPDRIPSYNSDIRDSNHQNTVPLDENYAEAEYMDESDGIDEMDEMTADPLEDGIDDYSGTPQMNSLSNQRKPDNMMKIKASTIKTSSLGTTVMPPITGLEKSHGARIPGLDKHQSARKANRGTTPDGINRLANGNVTMSGQGKTVSAGLPRMKNNHDTNHSNQASATTTSSDSAESSQKFRQTQQLQDFSNQNQRQYYHEQQLTPHEIQSEQTRELVKMFIGEIWNRGEIESIEKVCSPRLRFNGHTGLERVGHDGFSRMVMTVRSSLEGYHCEIHSMVVEGRKCFCRLKFTGKHVGELMGYPPTNKLVAWMGASEFTICPRKRLILKVWELGDIKTLEAQLMG